MTKYLHKEKMIPNLLLAMPFILPRRLKGIRKYISFASITEENFSNLLEDLENFWSYDDLDVLRCMIEFCEDKKLEFMLKKHEENVKTFCAETTIRELVECSTFGKNPDKYLSCVAEISMDPNTTKVKYLNGILKKLRDSLPQELAMVRIHICEFECSSVKVKWSVRTNTVSQIKEKMRKLFQDNPDFVAENQILCFTIDEDILYSTYNDKVRNEIILI